MTNLELAKSIKIGFFADRPSLEEAFDYANMVIGDNPAATTALWVVLNTVSRIITENESVKESQ
jgi:hypothetical protein